MEKNKTISTDGEILIISDAQAQFLEEILITDKPASPKLKSAMQAYMDMMKDSPVQYEAIFFANIKELLLE